jgi:hypothetical protein
MPAWPPALLMGLSQWSASLRGASGQPEPVGTLWWPWPQPAGWTTTYAGCWSIGIDVERGYAVFRLFRCAGLLAITGVAMLLVLAVGRGPERGDRANNQRSGRLTDNGEIRHLRRRPVGMSVMSYQAGVNAFGWSVSLGRADVPAGVRF